MADNARDDGSAPRTVGPGSFLTIFLGIATVGILIPLLYYTRSFLIPLAFAVLVFMLIVAFGNRVRAISVAGHQIPGRLARLLSFVIIFVILAATARVVSDQVSQISEAAPSFLTEIGQRINDLAPVIGQTATANLQASVTQFDAGAVASGLIAPVGAVLASGLLMFFYVLFMISERGSFDLKLRRAVGSADRAETIFRLTRSIATQVQKYMWINTLTSGLAAVVTYAVLVATGTNLASPLAILIFFTAFIPTIGTAFGIAAPALIALLQFGFTGPFWVVLFVGGILRLLVDNVVQPAMAGRGLNLSPLVVMIALAFWGGLWGIVGAFLSVPLTSVIMIVCSQIPALRPVAALMSTDGSLAVDDINGVDA